MLFDVKNLATNMSVTNRKPTKMFAEKGVYMQAKILKGDNVSHYL